MKKYGGMAKKKLLPKVPPPPGGPTLLSPAGPLQPRVSCTARPGGVLLSSCHIVDAAPARLTISAASCPRSQPMRCCMA